MEKLNAIDSDKLEQSDPQVQTANLWRLMLAQALSGANSVVLYATGAVVGSLLAPTALLATLPVSIFVLGMALCVFPAGELA